MFGTIARASIKPENRPRLEELMRGQDYQGLNVEGYVTSYVMFPDGRDDEMWIVAVFRDRDTYTRNADSPEQDARYRELRALLESDPEWTDGEFTQM